MMKHFLKRNNIIVFVISLFIFPVFSLFPHSFYRSVSTPISPPIEFWIILPVFTIIFLFLNSFLLILLLKKKILKAGLRTFLLLLTFFFSFYLIGIISAGSTTEPPPGIFPPTPTWWGFDWSYSGNLFIIWNTIGVILLIIFIIIFIRSKEIKKKIIFIIINITLYSVFLLPFVIKGSYVHGHEGGHVLTGCRIKLDILTNAVIDYAKENDDKMPAGNSIDEIINKINKYIDPGQIPYNRQIEICPYDFAREKYPEPYEWNKLYSGIEKSDLKNIDKMGLPFRCPYHKNSNSYIEVLLLNYLVTH